MAQIHQVGVGQRSLGIVDGVCYAFVKGRTIARRLPVMPASMYQTPASKKHRAIFTMVQWHLKKHGNTIRQTFTPRKAQSARNLYYQTNKAALAAALDTLADTFVATPQNVGRDDVEQAIAAYAQQNPKKILLSLRDGYGEVYLTGAWPSTITLYANSGDNTTIVIHDADGTTTTIVPDTGSTTVNDNPDSGNDSGSGSNTGSGSGTSSGSGDSGDSGNGNDPLQE